MAMPHVLSVPAVAPDSRPVLTAHDLYKAYNGAPALRGLSFSLPPGQIMGFLGPNGAGKTTAIRILTTILPADKGHFSIMDIPHTQPEKIRALIGVLPESSGFPMQMTGAEFLTYMGRLYGQAENAAAAKAVSLLDMFGLSSAVGKRISTYSRGMRQRLAIARSLVNDPRVLFLDEPTLGFDPKGQREMLQIIQEAARTRQVAILLCSHLLEVVEMICDQVVILNHGRTIAAGSVAEIKQQKESAHLSDAFLSMIEDTQSVS